MTMFDLAQFSLREMTELARMLRAEGERPACLEHAASRIVRLLYENLGHARTGERGCVSSAYGELAEEFREYLDGAGYACGSIPSETQCLVLVATVGTQPAWNRVFDSREHRVIPLYDADALRRVPMVARLLGDLGVALETPPDTATLRLSRPGVTSFDVFHVENARGSPWIPNQAGFVEPFRVASVLGFGGSLADDRIFTVVLFSRMRIDRETAALFRTLALSARLAVLDCGKPVPSNARAGV
jgi:hypothetical protein